MLSLASKIQYVISIGPQARTRSAEHWLASQQRPTAPRGTMPHRVCTYCSAEFACPASFRGKNPKCSGCRATHPQRQHALAHGGGAPQNGAGMPGNLMGPRQQGAGAPQVNPFTGAHQPGMMEMQQQMHLMAQMQQMHLMAQAQRGGGQAPMVQGVEHR